MTLAQEFQEADSVFVGRVIQEKDNYTTWRKLKYKLYQWLNLEANEEMHSPTYFSVSYKFEIMESLKNGRDSVTLWVETGRGGPDCGTTFQKGKSYLVFAYQENQRLVTSICQSNGPAEKSIGNIDTIRRLHD
jgi:hypothetical protein